MGCQWSPNTQVNWMVTANTWLTWRGVKCKLTHFDRHKNHSFRICAYVWEESKLGCTELNVPVFVQMGNKVPFHFSITVTGEHTNERAKWSSAGLGVCSTEEPICGCGPPAGPHSVTACHYKERDSAREGRKEMIVQRVCVWGRGGGFTLLQSLWNGQI